MALSLDSAARLALAAEKVKEYDRELGTLLLAVAYGDETALVAVHDRLLELGDAPSARQIAALLRRK